MSRRIGNVPDRKPIGALLGYSPRGTSRDGDGNGDGKGADGLGQDKLQIEVAAYLCTGCRLCEERAPEHIMLDYDNDIARVSKQPVGEAESANCVEAVEYCPTGGLSATAPRAKEDAA